MVVTKLVVDPMLSFVTKVCLYPLKYFLRELAIFWKLFGERAGATK